MNKLFTAPMEDQLVCREVAAVVANIPANEHTLIFTFKTRDKIDYAEKLRKAMERLGVDDRRVHILTWGQETSLNSYSHCRNVILCGILRIPNGRLAADMAGQMEDLEADITMKTIEATQASEMGTRAYQALSRGSMRVVRDGKTQAMNAWIINDNDRLQDLLMKVMPKANWTEWSGKFMKVKPAKKTAALAKEIEEALDKVTKAVISTKQFKRVFNFETNTNDEKTLFTRALTMALMRRPDWKLERRSLVKVRS
jgi:hypothetical protein